MDALMNQIAPDDIDLDYAPRPRSDVIEVPVGSELVVVDPMRRAHVLNPIAAVIWRCFDGQGTLAEIVDDLQQATGGDAEEVRAHVVALAREMGRADLLDGVALPEEVVGATDWTPPEPMEVGAELEAFTLPDMDGNDRSLESLRGRKVLLVNWSPTCGFCKKISDGLAEVQDTLSDRDVDLVFVKIG